ncbi:MAG: erythromycin esterase [Candidatus Angelobacter sp. Gp1-AA117]|nr:MAG: erythromycin esterase [Candidatus Angelobacter sp. Gp1-AA117]
MATKTLQTIRNSAIALRGGMDDYDTLLEFIGNARFVLIGEASHGTHEFYRRRAEITKRLIAEKGFQGVAAEADWPDAYRVHRFVHARGPDANANEALGEFRRFPAWMWRNADVLDFVGWLRDHNDNLEKDKRKAGFFGLDLYSLHASMQAVLVYLDKVDPDAAQRARYRYSCFEHIGDDPQSYGYAASFDLESSCENEVVAQLVEMRRRAADLATRDGKVEPDEFWAAEQNARVVKNAEQYYRSMFQGRISSWNLRDTHMMETLESIAQHLGPESKLVVWAHNSHLGDARATQMGEQGELNVGQLVRQSYANQAVFIGFSTYHGTVTAASDWGGDAERKNVRPGLPKSYEELFHETDIKEFLLLLRNNPGLKSALGERLERAIGVIYAPHSERVSHYFHACIGEQFDAIIHIDSTRALEPLERSSIWEEGELPETFPYAV